jgi:hypothetical protein
MELQALLDLQVRQELQAYKAQLALKGQPVLPVPMVLMEQQG